MADSSTEQELYQMFLNHHVAPESKRVLKDQNKTTPSKTDTMMGVLLCHFSCVRLCVTPLTAAHQAPVSLGFSRQEHWSGLSFPSPMHESEK